MQPAQPRRARTRRDEKSVRPFCRGMARLVKLAPGNSVSLGALAEELRRETGWRFAIPPLRRLLADTGIETDYHSAFGVTWRR